MSFKSFKQSKSIRKAVACSLALTLAIGAIPCSISHREKKSEKNNKGIVEIYRSIPLGLSVKDVEKPLTSTTTAYATTNFSTTTTTHTDETTTISTTDVVTSTIPEVTIATTIAPTEEIVETPVETSEPESSDGSDEIEEVHGEPPREYVVYKPSTHYIHKNICRWYNGECYEITSTEGIEARKCTECNPDMEIITPYNPPVQKPTPQQTVSVPSTQIVVSDYEYVMLCNLVAGEYGSNNVSVYDKGAVVATVIHRLWEGTRWTAGMPATIYNVIAAPCQYDGKYLSSTFSSKVTQSCKDAVTYALNNIHDYDYYTNPDGTSIYMINSFTGDGRYNWFRHS